MEQINPQKSTTIEDKLYQIYAQKSWPHYKAYHSVSFLKYDPSLQIQKGEDIRIILW
ncbi:MAG: hypothetical protein OXC44_02285 [Proteobacteria bacterium]|nr:hypothetical protein [Pseudomonadota bacterium]